MNLKEKIIFELKDEYKRVDKKLISKRVFDECIDCSFLEKKKIIEEICLEFNFTSLIDKYLLDDEVNEIMINSYDNVYIEKNGEFFSVDGGFKDKEQLMNYIYKVVSDVNRQVNSSSPIVDARLKDGSRVNVVLDPVSINGPTVTIRKFRSQNFTLNELKSIGTFDENILEFLIFLVRNNFNIFISGATSSGKTTLLNALVNYIDKKERIITIEDSAELRLADHPNVISLETKNSNFSFKSKITISNLIKTSLRMRPDRIIVGEVRGEEAVDMLQAMNTGHDGSLSTGHANSNLDMLYRLEMMILSSKNYPIDAIRNQILSGIDILINIKRCKDGIRRITSIDFLSKELVNKYKLINLFKLNYNIQNKKYYFKKSDDYDIKKYCR